MTTLVGQISVSSGLQSSGLDDVNRAIAAVEAVTRKNGALVEQAASSSRAMSDEAAGLVQMVSGFTLSEAGSASAPAIALAR